MDHNRIELGYGVTAWQRAVEAVQTWQMFNMPWLRLCWPTAPIRVGTEVAVLVRHFGFSSLNACRIVYLVDNDRENKRFGFGYGTLEEHGESGEERFTVEWNQASELVLKSRRVVPGRLLDAGFQFQFPDWRLAVHKSN